MCVFEFLLRYYVITSAVLSPMSVFEFLLRYYVITPAVLSPMSVFEFLLRYYAGSTKSYECFRILVTLLRRQY